MIKKYLLFASKFEYPEGSISDLKGNFNTINEVTDYIVRRDTLIGIR